MIRTYVPLPENVQERGGAADHTTLSPMEESYLVRRGDTAYGIAKCLQIGLQDLVMLNEMDPPYMIRIGQSIVIPKGAKLARCQAELETKTVRSDNEGGLDPNQNNFDVDGLLVISPPAISEGAVCCSADGTSKGRSDVFVASKGRGYFGVWA